MSAFRDAINSEISQIENESKELNRSFDSSCNTLNSSYGVIVAGRASYIVKIYGGFEKILKRFSKEDMISLDSSSWHAELIQQSSIAAGTRTTPIISSEVYEKLNVFRSFRHRERVNYSSTLENQRVEEIAKEIVEFCPIFFSEIRSFLDKNSQY